MAQGMVSVSQIEQIAQRVFEEQAEKFRQELWQEMSAQVPRRSEAEERVWQAIYELARAQVRTEKAIGELSRHMGYLSNLIGADLEVDAEEILRYTMRQKGYRLLGPARPVEIDGDIDVALPVESPAGQRLWAVVEAKTRVREKEVEPPLQERPLPAAIEQSGCYRPLLALYLRPAHLPRRAPDG